jgi:hypothetical protein
MKKDIPIFKVEDLAIAIAPREEGSENAEYWDAYLINLKESPIQNVIVNSRGFGEQEGNAVKTSQFRFFFEEIGPLSLVQIEVIPENLFDFTNEFWVSFSYEGYLFDKKYVFVRGSLTETNFTPIPFLGRRGVMIR